MGGLLLWVGLLGAVLFEGVCLSRELNQVHRCCECVGEEHSNQGIARYSLR